MSTNPFLLEQNKSEDIKKNIHKLITEETPWINLVQEILNYDDEDITPIQKIGIALKIIAGAADLHEEDAIKFHISTISALSELKSDIIKLTNLIADK